MRKYVVSFFAAVSLVTLTGCQERTLTTYLYGPAKSCFPNPAKPQCESFRVYDKLVVKVQPDSQNITTVRISVGLDATNSVFQKLNACKVIDRETFSCDDFVRLEGKFVDTKALGDLHISTSYWAYAYTHYLHKTLSADSIGVYERFDSWITGIAVLICFVIFVGAMA